MKIVLFIFFILFICVSISAQPYGWRVIYEPPEGDVSVVEFADSLYGWIMTRNGIRRTTDGGLTWSEPFRNVLCTMLNFVNRKQGWSVGYNGFEGIIYKTNDNGKTWYSVYKKYQQDLFGKALNKDTLFAVGHQKYPKPDSSVIIKTFDGGNTFITEARRDSPFVKYRKIDFTDSLNGWIYGEIPFESCILLKTSDGGNVWTRINIQKDIQLFQSLFFLDSSIGWGWYYGQMFKTTYGGYNWEKAWEPVPHQREPAFKDIHFIDSLTGWAFGNGFYLGTIKEVIYKTTDGGFNWNEESVGLSRSAYKGKMFSSELGYAAADEAVLKYGLITSVEKINDTPKGFSLRSNYPNPFNSSTIIEYEISEYSDIELNVYDITGRELETLVNEEQGPGVYKVRFDSKDYSSGIYFYKLKTRSFGESKGMLMLK